jgi:hypothetical protein
VFSVVTEKSLPVDYSWNAGWQLEIKAGHSTCVGVRDGERVFVTDCHLLFQWRGGRRRTKCVIAAFVSRIYLEFF